MLKIIDSVDLKELEKFGFEYEPEMSETNPSYIYKLEDNLRANRVLRIGGYPTSRFLYIENDIAFYGHDVDDIIFDLIQAGLVEKVVSK